MSNNPTPVIDPIEEKRNALALAARIRAQQAEAAQTVQSPPPQELDVDDFESGANLWNLLRTVKHD